MKDSQTSSSNSTNQNRINSFLNFFTFRTFAPFICPGGFFDVRNNSSADNESRSYSAEGHELLVNNQPQQAAEVFFNTAVNNSSDCNQKEYLDGIYFAVKALLKTKPVLNDAESLELILIRVRDAYAPGAEKTRAENLIDSIRQYIAALPKPLDITGFIAPEECEGHMDVPGATNGHPESKKRISNIRNHINTKFKNLFQKISLTVSQDDVKSFVSVVHDKTYINILNTDLDIINQYPNKILRMSSDNLVSSGSKEAIYTATQASLSAYRAIVNKKITNGFVAVRPPGHHAKHNEFGGFCFLNNVATTALVARSERKKVLIVDIDAHHGNGTLDVLTQKTKGNYDFSDDIQLIDLFAENSYVQPGKFNYDQTLFAQCISLPKETEITDYMTALNNALDQVKQRNFKPDLVIVSAGFDGHQKDTLIGLQLTSEDYSVITRRICEFAEENCESRTLFILEGGYNLDALKSSVFNCFEQLRCFATLKHTTAPQNKLIKELLSCSEKIDLENKNDNHKKMKK